MKTNNEMNCMKIFKKDLKSIQNISIQPIQNTHYSRNTATDPFTIRGRDQSFALSSFSTYPIIDGVKQGEPNCDHVGCLRFTNSSVAVIADGCGWGSKSSLAAHISVESSLDYIQMNIQKCRTTHDIGELLIKTIIEAHTKIIEQNGKEMERGTCTILISISITTTENTMKTLLISIGDCKAMIYSNKTNECQSITGKWHKTFQCTTQCGGRIGGNEMILKGSELKMISNEQDDIILCMTDGFYDNITPTICGINKEQQELLNEVISKRIDVSANLLDFIENISQYLIQETSELREFHSVSRRVRHQGLKGKLDHSTIMVYRITQENDDIDLIDIISPEIYKSLYPYHLKQPRVRSRSFDLKDIQSVNQFKYVHSLNTSSLSSPSRYSPICKTPRIYTDVKGACSLNHHYHRKTLSGDTRYSISPPLKPLDNRNSQLSPEFLTSYGNVSDGYQLDPNSFVKFFMESSDI
ncbi:PPM-type phosphatase domain-containing protein [Entamoeba marina]